MSIIDNKDFMQEIDQLIEIGQKHGQLSRVTVVHLLSNNNLLPLRGVRSNIFSIRLFRHVIIVTFTIERR